MIRGLPQRRGPRPPRVPSPTSLKISSPLYDSEWLRLKKPNRCNVIRAGYVRIRPDFSSCLDILSGKFLLLNM